MQFVIYIVMQKVIVNGYMVRTLYVDMEYEWVWTLNQVIWSSGPKWEKEKDNPK